MNNKKHSPTPWEKRKDRANGKPLIVAYDRKICIAVAPNWLTSDPRDEMEANFDLIVLATTCHYELLKALQGLSSAIDNSWVNNPDHFRSRIPLWHAARAAIANAKPA